MDKEKETKVKKSKKDSLVLDIGKYEAEGKQLNAFVAEKKDLTKAAVKVKNTDDIKLTKDSGVSKIEEKQRADSVKRETRRKKREAARTLTTPSKEAVEFVNANQKGKAKAEEAEQKAKAKKATAEKPKKAPKPENPAYVALQHFMAGIVNGVDKTVDAIFNLFIAIGLGIEKIAVVLVNLTDKALDALVWNIQRLSIYVTRSIHVMRVGIQKNIRAIRIVTMIVTVIVVGGGIVYASAVDYEYAYNGKPLGVIKEQRQVIEILDLVSDELSKEYGSKIAINPETDITFTPVVSFGKELDDMDTILKRFTYMGEIQTNATQIVVDGDPKMIVESETTAKEVIDAYVKSYLSASKDTTKYEDYYIGNDVQFVPIQTSLANVVSKSAALQQLKEGGQAEAIYTVVAGDTLYGICDKCGITFTELKKMNPKIASTQVIHVGDTFKVMNPIPTIRVITTEVSTFTENVAYGVEYTSSANYFVGESVVIRNGVYGKAKVTARLGKENGETVSREDLSYEIIQQPVTQIIARGTKPIPPRQGTGTFIRPLSSYVFASKFGVRFHPVYKKWLQHNGVDLAAPTGTTIRACDGGTVIFTGFSNTYGYYLKIDHGANITTVYAHCSQILVTTGTKVYQGQAIAKVGMSGVATGPHLHLEFYKNGKVQDPQNYIKF